MIVQRAPLKRVAQVIAGQSPPSTEVADLSRGLPFIQGNAEFGSISPSPILQCDSAPKVARSGDTLISVRAPVGAINRADQALGIGRGVAAIRPSGIDSGFLPYFLESQIDELHSRATGTTFKAVSAEDIGTLSVEVLSLVEQRRIAKFLDDQVGRIDNIIAARKQQAELAAESLDALRERAILGHESKDVVPPVWEPFGEVPRNWSETLLRSVPCFVQTGPFGSQLHSDEYVEDGWPVVNPAGIVGSRLVAVPGMSVSAEVRERLARHILEEGDVVFGRRGELGRAGLVTNTERGWLLGTGSLLVRLAPGAPLTPTYLSHLLRTRALRHYFETMSVGSTMANLNTGILLAMPILLPSLAEQTRIAEDVDALEAAGEQADNSLTQSVRALDELKRSLITSAVSGEFDVSTADGSGVGV